MTNSASQSGKDADAIRSNRREKNQSARRTPGIIRGMRSRCMLNRRQQANVIGLRYCVPSGARLFAGLGELLRGQFSGQGYVIPNPCMLKDSTPTLQRPWHLG